MSDDKIKDILDMASEFVDYLQAIDGDQKETREAVRHIEMAAACAIRSEQIKAGGWKDFYNKLQGAQ